MKKLIASLFAFLLLIGLTAFAEKKEIQHSGDYSYFILADGGFILAPGCDQPPNILLENLQAMPKPARVL